ncbi:DUF5107 domain-containing protein [Allokutzneria albata]|uniref:DUF5107 domain-containing protein n=1 Tax=Allokutzneria albata TaxID=211114 RepID=UPI0007C83770|nr:DUF5107 domain-containing protein [Allokutzneria albata]
MTPLGEPNPLPPLGGLLDAPYDMGFPYGQVRTMMPYLMQDGYGRSADMTAVDTVVLENSRLRATFLPGWGGRLWSLVDKETESELLHVPDVLQLANLALRNAWFAGGVEWNIGTRGHSPTTCSRMFAARVGEDRLRMWEWERLRGVVFSVDAWLPEDSAALFVGVRIHNPSAQDTPMYWWSNAAVPETADLRVIAPAKRAYRTSYEGSLSEVDVTEAVQRPARSPDAADYFYLAQEPWIAVVDASGRGLKQVSTPELKGRKQFCWGNSTGGKRWQQWLGGGPYCEIQAGLACTQYEHVRLRAGDTIRWVEAYGPAGIEPDLDVAAFDAALELEPGELFSLGSGWGVLEDPPTSGVSFPESALGVEQQPWLELLRSGTFPDGEPNSYVHGAEWERRLAAAPQNWATHYHRGVIAHADGRTEQARRHYEQSLELRRTAWALRGLGLLDGDAELLAEALAEAPHVWQLAVEAVDARAGTDALALLDSLRPEVAAHGRLRLARVRAALEAGRREEAAALLKAGIEVPDLREGEISLDRLWARACPGEPVPAHYDFRMHGG